MDATFAFEGELFEEAVEAAWVFVSLPVDVADEIVGDSAAATRFRVRASGGTDRHHQVEHFDLPKQGIELVCAPGETSGAGKKASSDRPRCERHHSNRRVTTLTQRR